MQQLKSGGKQQGLSFVNEKKQNELKFRYLYTIMKNKTIKILDVVDDFVTNAGGFALYTSLKQVLDSNDLVVLSFKGVSGTSSSFLNSSIGALVDEYGISVLQKIKPVDVSVVQAAILKKYIASLRKIA